ncbi:sensory neuron membrane protein 1-like [Galendromus occidentalis]|uniref:Scavenger receptor class B member 1 n=1 Tax=Galendromus occidentalis TaxID=34638 RepID=A0AAJ6VX97_9ACAR|nr:sensory neuron membrane protein 1-like [Galendromus occidentalis]
MKKPGPCLTAIGCMSLMFGLMSTTIALFALIKFDLIFVGVLNKHLALSPESPNFHYWTDMEDHYDVRLAWYFFNLTNPREFKSGEPPVLKEVGPFWYYVSVVRDDMQFHANHTVTFRETHLFEFDEENVLSEETPITTVNVPLLIYLYRVRAEKKDGNKAVKAILEEFPETESVVLVRKVRDLTYGGTDSLLMKAISEEIQGDSLRKILDERSTGKFSFAIQRNMTESIVINMYTGIGDFRQRNRVHSIDGQHVLKVWPIKHEECNSVDGSLGFFKPTGSKTSEFVVYMPEFCRKFKFRESKKTSWRSHEVERFYLARDNFFDHRIDPKKACYNGGFDGPKSGSTGVWPCRKGSTVMISLPHFLYRDQLEEVQVKGLTPRQDQHEYTMDIDPLTGLVVSLSGRLQSNVPVVRSNFVEAAAHLNPVMYPIFWQEYRIEADYEIRDMLRQMSGAPYYLQLFFMAIATIGSILTIFGLFLWCQ